MLAILLLFFSALGRRIFRQFKISFTSFSEELSFSFGLGSGIIIFLIVGLATLRILHEIVVVGLILILFGFVEWLRFRDLTKDEQGLTYREQTNIANQRLRDRWNAAKAGWSKDPNKQDMAARHQREWAGRRRFEQ